MVAGIRETFKTKEQVSPQELEQGLRAVVYDGVCTQSMVVLTSGTFLICPDTSDTGRVPGREGQGA